MNGFKCERSPWSLQKYRYHDEETPPLQHSPAHLTTGKSAEMLHLSDAGHAPIDGVHGYTPQMHMSPAKVRVAGDRRLSCDVIGPLGPYEIGFIFSEFLLSTLLATVRTLNRCSE